MKSPLSKFSVVALVFSIFLIGCTQSPNAGAKEEAKAEEAKAEEACCEAKACSEACAEEGEESGEQFALGWRVRIVKGRELEQVLAFFVVISEVTIGAGATKEGLNAVYSIFFFFLGR